MSLLYSFFMFSRTGYSILHPLVFVRLFPTLINLYVLHHAESDQCYQRGVNLLREMDVDRLVRFIKIPTYVRGGGALIIKSEINRYLSIPSEWPLKELRNACFSFEIDHSKLKLWALKDTVKIEAIPWIIAHGAKAKIGRFGSVKTS